MPSIRFSSRIDLLLAAVIVIPLVLVFGVTAVRAGSHGAGARVVVLLGNALVFGLVGWVFLDTSYTLTATELLIRCGPLRAAVVLANIERVRRSNTLLSAPALSLRRLELEGPSGVLAVISPDDLEGFLAALKVRVPGVALP